jgi:hypothetical protein
MLSGACLDLLRFFMETNEAKEREFAAVFAQPEPGKLTGPPAPSLEA